MKKIWFTSDTHFNHANIIKYSNRPFDSVQHMNESLIEQWNKNVKQGDTVYHLGDVLMGRRDEASKFINSLNGNIVLIPGNHDHPDTIKIFEKKFGYYTEQLKQVREEGQRIVLCHYAMRIWNKSHHGTWHLYGHSHNALENEPWGRSMDVGVDAAAALGKGYRPFNFDEIKEIMDKREVHEIDHHTKETSE